MPLSMVTTVLEVLAVLSLLTFAVLWWWPAVLLVVAAVCMAASWRLGGGDR